MYTMTIPFHSTLNLFTSNWVQRCLRGLGIFGYTASLKISASIKNTQNFWSNFITFLQNCWRINTFCWTELVQTTVSFTASFILIGLTGTSCDSNAAVENFPPNQLHFEKTTTCCIHSIPLIWILLESSFRALSKIKVVVVINKF